MSSESTDSESTPNDEHVSRSRSLLRQVRATFARRSLSHNRAVMKATSSTTCDLREKHRSAENVSVPNGKRTGRPKKLNRTATPVSFSHRLSLLSQFKSHLTGSRRDRLATPPIDHDTARTRSHQLVSTICSSMCVTLMRVVLFLT